MTHTINWVLLVQGNYFSLSGAKLISLPEGLSGLEHGVVYFAVGYLWTK